MYSFSSFSCYGMARSSCKIYYSKFQLWYVTFPRFPGWNCFFLLGVPWVLCDDSSLIILCSKHLFLCCFPMSSLRIRTVSTSSFYSQISTWCLDCCRCLREVYKQGTNEKDVLLVLQYSKLKVREILSRGDSRKHKFLFVLLIYRSPPIPFPSENSRNAWFDWPSSGNWMRGWVFTRPIWRRVQVDRRTLEAGWQRVPRRPNSLGAWMAQLDKRPTSAQVMIFAVCEFKPHVGLCADSSEPGACFGFCVFLSLSLPLPHSCSVCLSQK